MTAPSFSEEKLTAYALGELSPEERRLIEAEIAASPELQAEVKAIRDFSADLRGELLFEAEELDESSFTSAPEEKEKNIPSAHEGGEKIIPFPRRYWASITGLLATAACAAFLLWPQLKTPSRPEKAGEVSFAEKEKQSSLQSQVANKPQNSPIPAPATAPSIGSGDGQNKALQEEVRVDLKQKASASDKLQDSMQVAVSVSSTPALPKADAQPLEKAASQLAEAEPVPEEMPEEVAGLPGAKKTISTFGAAVVADEAAFASAGEASALSRGNAITGGVPASSAPRQSGTGLYADDRQDLDANYSSSGSFRSTELEKNVKERKSSLRRVDPSNEDYAKINDNPFLRVADQALSTFSIDVDTGAYTNLRRFLNQGQLPPKDAVRIEELVNYFQYNYPQPRDDTPFSVNTEVAKAPWNNEHLLVRIGLQGKTVEVKDRPAANLVFLIDVSGSMSDANKLPLVIESMKLLVNKLKPSDRVAIAVYAGSSGLVLPSTSLENRGEILESLERLRAGGSTNGAMGIHLAYDIAKANFIEGGINRVILCTDGDFNVGVTNRDSLVKLIEEKAKSKVFLSIFGFGMGNLKDATLEQLANKGNGNYGYIDNKKEAKRVFVDQLSGTLQTIAKDVKIQVEFNPAVIGSYRLIGYENRLLAARDFNDDKKDAGEIGAGHRVTALYELVPVGVKSQDAPSIDPLKYQKAAPVEYAGDKSEIMNVKLRYKQPEGDVSKLIEQPVKNEGIREVSPQKGGWFSKSPEAASADFQFATGVAAFGMILRDSPYKGQSDLDMVFRLLEPNLGQKEERKEFMDLVKKAKNLLPAESKSK